MDEIVVLVHGLWMNGLDMSLLRHRIEAAGYPVRRIVYPSLKQCPAENARLLQSLIAGINTSRLHFVAHSLGGLVIRHLFYLYPEQPPGHIVTLGTPHQSSSAARQLQKIRSGRLLLGKSVENGLLGQAPPWRDQLHPLGVIAGTLRLGMGMIVPGVPRPNDGTVAVAETRLDGMADHISLPVSHFGLLLSRNVADQTLHFLHHARFDRAQAG